MDVATGLPVRVRKVSGVTNCWTLLGFSFAWGIVNDARVTPGSATASARIRADTFTALLMETSFRLL